ncbi:branched-chain amino acid ABC transporter permease [Brenneria corticis]|uniref:Branched-chain amino acid ABC transporter permease n=1 Tax=Brenneria corticis TaxID=2173106 RepID=A0A2U1U492_9GAMM|nr:branched-chain amino acid ABC transporter permease [Brenneria sp. CFCC 11842]PWC16475.1 branched-chain amino acid ABC transporter permease [Brenneria sp. CFCC 11842]
MPHPTSALRRALPRALNPALIALLVIAYALVPLFANEYLFDAVLTPFLALSLAALGLNILAGYTGQVSLGSAAFMAVGAYAALNLILRLPFLPLPAVLLLAGTISALLGLIFGLPSLRLSSFYLAISTLATQFFVQWALNNFGWFSNHSPSGVVSAAPLRWGSWVIESSASRYFFTLLVVSLLTWLVVRLAASSVGRDFISVRDNPLAARVIGVPILRTKMIAFGFSSFIIGIAGVLWSFTYLRNIEPAGFNLDRSFQILFIIIIGGLGTVRGAFLGAALLTVFPLLLSRGGEWLLGRQVDSGVLELLQQIILGLILIGFLIVEPKGLAALTQRLGRLTVRRRKHGA